MRDVTITILVALLAAGIWIMFIFDRQDCLDQGGDYVRGAFWMECINKEDTNE